MACTAPVITGNGCSSAGRGRFVMPFHTPLPIPVVHENDVSMSRMPTFLDRLLTLARVLRMVSMAPWVVDAFRRRKVAERVRGAVTGWERIGQLIAEFLVEADVEKWVFEGRMMAGSDANGLEYGMQVF